MPEQKEFGLYRGATEDSFVSTQDLERERVRNTYPDKKERSLDFDRVTNYLEEGQRIMEDFEIGQREATFVPQAEYPDLPIVTLLASDIHYGSMGVRYDKLRRYLDIINDLPNFYLATNGDDADNFNSVFHASGMSEDPLPPQVQSRAIANKLRELDKKGKIAVISQGNHNDANITDAMNWYDTFLGEFNCPVFTTGGKLHMLYGGIDYKIVLNHTYWGRSKLNVTNAAKRLMEYEGGGDCDIAWVGHTHQSSYEHFERGGKDVLAVVSGTFKEIDKWAAKKGIGGRGQNPGICVMMWPGQRKIQAFKDIETAVDYMNALIG